MNSVLQPDHGLARAEIKAFIDEANFTSGQKVFENPEPGGRQNHSGAVGSATRGEGQPEIGMNAESVGQFRHGRVRHGDSHRQASARQCVPHLEDRVGWPV